jgi:glutamyl-tRNA reductase
MPIVVLGLSHRTSPVTLRERFAFADEVIPGALRDLQTRGLAQEAVILSTCNRVEVYAATPLEGEAGFAALRRCLFESRGGEGAVLNGALYAYAEPHSLEHLFRVACGLDSMVLGETEILGQLKRAYDLALRHRLTGSQLNKTFQRAFNVAKEVRTETQIQRGNVSVASVAVDLAERIFGTLDTQRVLVIGAGETSEKTARALCSRGAAGVVVTNRSVERAQALAESLGATAVGFDAWEEEFGRIDIVISSTSAPHYVLDSARLEPLMSAREQRPLLLIDIAVPRDIDPAVNELENVFLYNIDDLQSIADASLKQRQEEIAHCEHLIAERARGLLAALHHGRPASSA